MKCPSCQFVCSDLRDLCPKCYLDLRAHKKLLSLPVTAPHATYAELVKKAQKSPPKKLTSQTTTRAMPSNRSSGGSLFKRLADFTKEVLHATDPARRKEAAVHPKPMTSTTTTSSHGFKVHQSSTSEKASSPSAPLPKSPEVKPQPIVPPPAQSVPETPTVSVIEEDVDLKSALREFEQDLPQDKTEETLVTSFSSSIEEKESESPRAREENAQALHVGGVSQAQIFSIDQVITPITTEPSPSLAMTPEDEAIRPPPEPVIISALLEDERPLSAEFANASKSLEGHIPQEFELSFEQFSTKPDEQGRLFFELAMDSLVDPEARTRYTKEIHISENRKVEAPELAKQLKSVERVVDAPTFSLKKGSVLPTLRPKEEHTIRIPEMAPVELRSQAAFRDLYVMGGIALLLTIGATIFCSDPLWLALTDSSWNELYITDFYLPIGYYLAALVILSALYPFVLLLVQKATFGMRSLNLQVVTTHGRTPRLARIAIRSLSAPLACVLCGPRPLFKGTEATLVERLSGTILARREDIDAD